MPAARIREPWRHFPGGHRVPNRLGPRPDVDIGDQRHRSRSPRAMALLAMLLQNRLDVAVKRRTLLAGRPGGHQRDNPKTSHIFNVIETESSKLASKKRARLN